MQIIETVKDYEISFNYDPVKVQALKRIDGSWYQGAKKVWHVPRHRQREINYLRERFEVSVLAPKEQVVPEQVGEIEPLPELTIDIPLLLKPYPYQSKGIAYAIKNKRVIIGDQPGLGKTLQGIGTICSFGVNENNFLNAGPGLVICPSSLKLNWQKEWKEVAGRRSMILSDNIINSWWKYYTAGMCDVFIVNYESLKKFFVQPGWTKPKVGKFKMNQIPFRQTIDLFKWLIVDESHNCKDGDRQKTKLALGIARGKEIVLELTGTPVLNKTKDLIAQLSVINQLANIVSHIPKPLDKFGKPTDHSGYTRFMERYCADDTYLKELNYRLNKYCFFRRLKSEVHKDLPAKMRQVVRCDITNRGEYDQAVKEFVKFLKETKDSTDPAIKRRRNALALIKLGALKQIAAKGKIEAAREFIEELVDGGQKVVVFIHLKEISKQLRQLFPAAVTVTGDDSMEERNEAVHDFQKCKVCGVRLESHVNKGHDHEPSDTNIIICSSAGGEGITLTASSEVLFVEFPWTYGKCEQYEDRVHRISQENGVRATYLLGAKTVDEYCYFDIVLKKKTLSEEVTGTADNVEEELIDNLLNLFNQK